MMDETKSPKLGYSNRREMMLQEQRKQVTRYSPKPTRQDYFSSNQMMILEVSLLPAILGSNLQIGRGN
jgi:hypothetical protein